MWSHRMSVSTTEMSVRRSRGRRWTLPMVKKLAEKGLFGESRKSCFLEHRTLESGCEIQHQWKEHEKSHVGAMGTKLIGAEVLHMPPFEQNPTMSMRRRQQEQVRFRRTGSAPVAAGAEQLAPAASASNSLWGFAQRAVCGELLRQ